MASIELCIYCGGCFDPTRGEGDHIIPAALGEFRDDTRFRRACPACNAEIGHAEQQLVQSGPEGYFRRNIKPRSKRLNRRGIGRPCGARGAPPPQYLADMGGHLALVEPKRGSPGDASPVDQILVRDQADQETYLRLYPGIRVEQIQQGLRRSGLGEMKEVRLSCSDDCWNEYTTLLGRVWPESRIEETEPIPGTDRLGVPGQIKFVVNDDYFRALAKIGFHYFLAHSHRAFKGNESCFAALREFITTGGESDTFFKPKSRPTFELPFGKLANGGVVTPGYWCHVLAASEADGHAVAYVQLFLGQGCMRPPHYISLGTWTSRLVLPNSSWGHVYIYDAPQRDGRYAGRVVRAQVTRVH